MSIARNEQDENKATPVKDSVVNDRRQADKKKERRERNERRGKQVPVAVDRRKGDRRTTNADAKLIQPLANVITILKKSNSSARLNNTRKTSSGHSNLERSTRSPEVTGLSKSC